MGRTERKLKKKTRLERLDVYINRLSQFNTNAMHEVGKLAAALRYYADGGLWGAHECVDPEVGGLHRQQTVWKPKEEPTAVARSVLNSLGLPWDQFPKTKDGQPSDPSQPEAQSVLKSIGENMKAEEADLSEDDRSDVVNQLIPAGAEREAQYGRYTKEGVEKVDPLEVPLQADLGAASVEIPKTKDECDDQDRDKYNAWAETEKKDGGDIPPEEK